MRIDRRQKEDNIRAQLVEQRVLLITFLPFWQLLSYAPFLPRNNPFKETVSDRE
jgi:hypothetical protein